MKIRKAVLNDSENISELISGLSEKFITEEFSSRGREYLLSTMTPDSIRTYMQSGYRYDVAEIENQIVGAVAIRDNFHLYHLFVAESHQCRGIAKKLWEIAKDISLSNGNTGEFTVNSSRFAIGVYQQLGFITSSGQQTVNDVEFFPMKLTINRHS